MGGKLKDQFCAITTFIEFGKIEGPEKNGVELKEEVPLKD